MNQTWFSIDNGTNTTACYNCTNFSTILNNEFPTNTTGLVGWWKFNSVNGSNYTLDSSGVGNDGKLYNGSSSCFGPSDCPQLVDGKFGSALQFDGVNDYVNVGTLGNFGSQMTNSTIEAWVYPKSNSVIMAITSNKNTAGSANAISLALNRKSDGTYLAGSVAAAIGSNDASPVFVTVATNANSVPVNQWTHIVAVYNVSQAHINIYVNGINASIVQSATTPITNVTNFIYNTYFGARNVLGSSTDLYFNGTIDEIRIYNRSLSAAEVMNDYALSAGQHNVTVYANDSSGKVNSTSVTFIVDATPPALSIQLPQNTTYASTSRALNFTASDDIAIGTCWYQYNGTNTTLSNCANMTFTALNNQQSTLTLYANDSSGKVNSANVTFTVNTPCVANTDYYVAANGSDSNDGSIGHPWKTLQQAGNCAVAGDTVHIRNGTYYERLVIANVAGNASAWLTFTNYSGETVTIDGINTSVPNINLATGGLVDISNSSYVNISGLIIINSNSIGAYVTNSSHIQVYGNYFFNTKSSAINFQNGNNYKALHNEVVNGSNINGTTVQEVISFNGHRGTTIGKIENFEIAYNTIHKGINTWSGGGGEGIDAKNGANHGKIHHNTVYDIAKIGIYVDAWDENQTDIEVYENVVHSLTGAASGFGLAAENGGTLSNVSVHHNIAYNNRLAGYHITGLKIPMYGIGNGSLINITINNNVFYNNNIGMSIPNKYDPIYNLTIENNIVYGNELAQIVSGRPFNGTYVNDTITINHNLVYPFMNWSYNGYGANLTEVSGNDYISADPLFVNVSSYDFHLKSQGGRWNGTDWVTDAVTSPAIDAGDPSSDYSFEPFPNGGRIDLGAYGNTNESSRSNRSLHVVPSINITVITWNTSGNYYKSWNESSSNSSVSSYHVIGDFPANTKIVFRKNSAYWNTFTSNSSGYINFTYSEGYSNIQFEALQDTTPPTVSLSLSSTSIYVGYSITIACSASDNYQLSSTSLTVTKPSGISASASCNQPFTDTSASGTYTVTYSATDTSGNSASTPQTFAVNQLQQGGSSKSSAAEESKAQTITATTNDVVEKITVNLNAQIAGASVSITKMENIPEDVLVPVSSANEIAYQYFNITKNNFNNSQIKNASIEFVVNKSWINENNITNVSLARYENGWKKLKTELTSQTASQNIYRAYADGFSYFAIVGEKARIVQSQQNITEQTVNKTETNKTNTSNDLKLYVWVAIAMAVVLIIAVVYKFRKSKKK